MILNATCDTLRMCGARVVFVCSPYVSVGRIIEVRSNIRTLSVMSACGGYLAF